MDLLARAANVYSQAGEDGIIAAALGVLPASDRWCVEFGAWDGKHLSNTRALIEQRGYSAVLIEADRSKFAELQANYAERPNVVALNRMVGFSAADGLDALLSATPIPPDFDLLVVDIDGCDWHVWNAVEQYKPKLVCIEFNPTIPLEVDFVQPADARVKQGSSLAALVRLGKSKGYELICAKGCNGFFVRDEFFPLFGIADNSPAALWRERTEITYLFSGYDGTVHLAGYKRLPWHGYELHERALQILPPALRQYPLDWKRWQRLLNRAWSWIYKMRYG
jgi:hypothetical protein